MNPHNKDKYPGRAPIKAENLQKHHKGEGVNLSNRATKIKNKTIRQKLKHKEQVIESAIEETARAELLLTEEYGRLEADAGETTTQFKQRDIVANVDITSCTKYFNLGLEFGPYCLRYTKNGRYLVLGGRKGHVAAFDWVTKKLLCELNVMESVHDVTWLHVETMFAVAQKSWVYIYDSQGIELHCLKKLFHVNKLEFLPYHFLLANGSREGYLAWLDVSIGSLVASYNSRLDNIAVMTQNPSNAVICVGNSKGVVSMWSPNSQQPLAKMLCHNNAVGACTVHPYGIYMATSSPDRTLKVWDIRQLAGPVHSNVLSSPAHQLSYSQRGLLGVSMGNVVEVYREFSNELRPYLRHKASWNISNMRFCPYEDVLGIGTQKGFQSLLIPGSAEANYDALEANPYQTRKQRREAEVKALLDKIQPELITLDTNAIGEVDVPTLKEKVEAKKKLLYLKPKEIDFKPRKTKARGRGGTAKVIKTKKILKDLKHREHAEITKNVNVRLRPKKMETSKKDYGVLNRFVQK